MKPDKKPDNPKVFPLRDPASKTEAQNQGLTLLDYFIPHAPSTPQWEFIVRMESKRPEEGGFHFEDVKDKTMKRISNDEAIQLWDKIYKEKRAKMWPSEWAHVQLKKRLKHL